MIHKDKWPFAFKISPKTGKKRHTTASINYALKPARITLLDDYVSAATPAIFRCECGVEWESTVHNVLYLAKGCPSPACPIPKMPPHAGRKASGGNKKNRNFFAAASEVDRIDHLTSNTIDQLVEHAHEETAIDRTAILAIIILTLRVVVITRDAYSQ